VVRTFAYSEGYGRRGLFTLLEVKVKGGEGSHINSIKKSRKRGF
jgi:hypothetical protein